MHKNDLIKFVRETIQEIKTKPEYVHYHDTSNYVVIKGNKAEFSTTQHKGFKDAISHDIQKDDLGIGTLVVKGSMLWAGYPHKNRVKGIELENGDKIYYDEYEYEYFSNKTLNRIREIMKQEHPTIFEKSYLNENTKLKQIKKEIDEAVKIHDLKKRFERLDEILNKVKEIGSAESEGNNENTEVVNNLFHSGYYDKLANERVISMNKKVEIKKDKWNGKIEPKNHLYIEKDLNMSNDKKNILLDFLNFVAFKIGLIGEIKVFYHNGRKDGIIVTTASYLPAKNENHINAKGRAIIDLMRSTAHELTHNRQIELGMFESDDHIQSQGGEIEHQADYIAGELIKDFCRKNDYDKVYDL